MTIGNKIKNLREQAGLTQEELAQKIGYKTRTSVNKIECAERGVPLNKIDLIANILNTTPEYLLGWEEDNQYKTDIDKADIIRKLIWVDVKAELILNRFKEVGLMVEPDGNPNSISTLLYDIQTDLNTLMFEILGISLDDDATREKYYQSTRKVKSTKNMEAVVNKASEILLENKED